MLNRVVLIGRLVRDPELRTTATGKDVVEFTIATPKKFKPTGGGPDADFFRIKAWGPAANYVNDYLSKGRLVAIDGRLDTRKYTDRDGNQREIIEIIADSVNGLDRPRDNAPAPSSPPNSSTGNANTPDDYDPFADE